MLVAAAVALAAFPAAVEFGKAAGARGAVGRGEAAPRGARVVVVNILGLVVLELVAGLLGP